MGSDDESNVSHVLEHIRALSLDDVELLLADSIHLAFVFALCAEIAERTSRRRSRRCSSSWRTCSIASTRARTS